MAIMLHKNSYHISSGGFKTTPMEMEHARIASENALLDRVRPRTQTISVDHGSAGIEFVSTLLTIDRKTYEELLELGKGLEGTGAGKDLHRILFGEPKSKTIDSQCTAT